MAVALVATDSGCRVFTETGEAELELAGRLVRALAPGPSRTCVAVVDEHEIWQRSDRGEWSSVAKTSLPLQCIASVNGTLFGGSKAKAAMVRVAPGENAKRLKSFDNVPGRSEWFANGPPLGVRALTGTADGGVILAAVHVGGIPRSSDGGETWEPTVPVAFDVHEVCAHPSLSNIVAAAASVGLCMSIDKGRNWKVLSKGLTPTVSLAVAVLPDEVLFSIQDGPFANRSQVWRWRIDGERLEQVRDGLPLWLKGKVDTAQIRASHERAAIVDGGGDLWLSTTGSSGWERIATDLPYAFGLLLV